MDDHDLMIETERVMFNTFQLRQESGKLKGGGLDSEVDNPPPQKWVVVNLGDLKCKRFVTVTNRPYLDCFCWIWEPNKDHYNGSVAS